MDWTVARDAMLLLGQSYESRMQCVQAIVQRAGRGRVRAIAQDFYVDGEAQDDTAIPEIFWRIYNLEQNWVTGDFRAGGNPFASDPTRYEAFGVMFATDDLSAMFPPVRPEAAATSAEGKPASDLEAPLVRNAKQAIRRDKSFADRAAKLMREGLPRAEAIRQVRYEDPHRAAESIERGIRNCLDLHYDAKGRPLDQN